MKLHEKLDKIKNDIQVQQESEGKDQLDLDVLLLMLHQSTIPDLHQQDQLKNKEMYNLPSWDDNIILKIAKKLKNHMEVDEKDREPNNETRRRKS
jgi:hypothetical protein